VVASLISDLVLKDRLYRIGLVVAVLSTAVMGLTTDVTIWALSRFIAGLSSAAGMLLGTGLILNWLIRHHHRSELGIHFSGIGLGIAGCAAAVALMSHWLDWREQWFAVHSDRQPAANSGPALAAGTRSQHGHQRRSADARQSAECDFHAPADGCLFLRRLSAMWSVRPFIVAIVDHLPGLTGRGTLVFLALGVAAAPACIVWDLIARRTGELNALIWRPCCRSSASCCR
jgi:hypothetical protein